MLGGSCGGGSSQRCAVSLGARTGGARAAAGGSPAATLLWHGPAVGNAVAWESFLKEVSDRKGS